MSALGALAGINPDRLDESGWGVIFSADADAKILEALEPLLERRREQRDRLPPLTLTLPDNDKARNIVVRAPSLAAYDQLDTDADADTDADPDPEWVPAAEAWRHIAQSSDGVPQKKSTKKENASKTRQTSCQSTLRASDST